MIAFGKMTEIIEIDYENYNYNSRDFFPFYDYQYYLDTREISSIYIPKISIEEGLQKALKWYLKNENKVLKKNQYSENSDEIIEIKNRKEK